MVYKSEAPDLVNEKECTGSTHLFQSFSDEMTIEFLGSIQKSNLNIPYENMIAFNIVPQIPCLQN